MTRRPHSSTRLRQGIPDALCEMIWPTRCAVCDVPGTVLCDSCRRDLPYLDWWRSCRLCGAPYGRMQCTECNPVILDEEYEEGPPFESCASVVTYEHGAARIVRAFKDQGERRLASEIARMMSSIILPGWYENTPSIVFIPSTAKAIRRRGFDHMEEIAHCLASCTGLPLAHVLDRPKISDQRALTKAERRANLSGRFRTLPGVNIPAHVLLIDDVYTTGATLFAGTAALRQTGSQHIHCLTFARVY